MLTEQAPAGPDLGAVLETFGGKSLRRIVVRGAVVFGSGLTGALLIRAFRPDYPVLATVVLFTGVVVALAYVSTTWTSALARVDVCEGGLRLLTYDGRGIELPWARVRQVRVGYFRKLRARPEHVVVRTTDGNEIEFPDFRRYGFWASLGTERFAAAVRKFVADVEVDVDFVRPKKLVRK